MDIHLINNIQNKTTRYNDSKESNNKDSSRYSFKDYMDKKVKESMKNINKENMVVDTYTKCKCNHNPNDNNNTLEFSGVRKMVTPNRLTAFCRECKQVFSFIEENGVLREE